MYRLDPLGSATCIRFVTRVTGITPSPGFGMTEGSDDGDTVFGASRTAARRSGESPNAKG